MNGRLLLLVLAAAAGTPAVADEGLPVPAGANTLAAFSPPDLGHALLCLVTAAALGALLAFRPRKEIQGGTNYRLKKGDVIVVPFGVPHWFKEVKAPFLYFVVKPLIPEKEAK